MVGEGLDLEIILLLAATALILGGIFKGISGMGLPLVAMPIMALAMPVSYAVSLLSVPVLLSNVMQIREGTGFTKAVKRFWPLLVGLCGGIIIGAPLLVSLSPGALDVALGAVVLAFLCSDMLAFVPAIPKRLERGVGFCAGLVGGLVGGISAMFGPPLIVFLTALGLTKEDFIPAIGLCYLTGCSALYLILIANSLLGYEEAALSLAAAAPAFIGMRVGRWLRDKLDQRVFGMIVRFSLAIIGANLILRHVQF